MSTKTSIPVPRLLAAFTSDPVHVPVNLPGMAVGEYVDTYILTELVPGRKLYNVWKQSTDEERRNFANEIGAELKATWISCGRSKAEPTSGLWTIARLPI